MATEPELLLVTEKTTSVDTDRPRPEWMHHGSFLVFRKLEQNVDAFHDLVAQNYDKYDCATPAHLGAKLMGRWPNGAPIAMPTFAASEKGFELAKHTNDFTYEPLTSSTPPSSTPPSKHEPRLCPLSAHIRKTNPRSGVDPNHSDRGLALTRIIRHGIPYGPEPRASKGDGLKRRGLLFACYQGSIEFGFKLMQADWCNNESFPRGGVGIDPIVGQHKVPAKMRALVVEGREQEKGHLPIRTRLVRFRGGEYFLRRRLRR